MSSDGDSSVKLKVECGQGATASGTARLETWTKSRSVRKGVNWLLGCWILALATIPIPFVHFFSVPALVLAGPIIGYVMFKLHDRSVDVMEGRVNCAACQTAFSLEKHTEEWPLSLTCPSCEAKLMITKEAGS